jgi:hypothetical protein
VSWLFSQALVEAFSAERSWAGEPCARLNVMPTAQPFWRSGKPMDASRFSRFGLTSRVSTAAHGEDLAEGLSGVKAIDMLEIQLDNALRYVASIPQSDGSFANDGYPVRRGTAMKLDDFSALVWVHGATTQSGAMQAGLIFSRWRKKFWGFPR